MEVKTWTREQISSEFSGFPSLSEVVIALENKMELEGKVICRVIFNGRRLTEQDEAQLKEVPIDELTTLEIEVDTANNLVAGTIKSLAAGLSDMAVRCVSVADLIREDPTGKAQVEFSNLMEQSHFLMEALTALRPRLVVSFESMQLWAKAEKQSRSMIQELLSGFEAKDFILVADVLEYEMYNLMDLWKEVLQKCEFE